MEQLQILKLLGAAKIAKTFCTFLIQTSHSELGTSSKLLLNLTKTGVSK